jgi:hypothetical protein
MASLCSGPIRNDAERDYECRDLPSFVIKGSTLIHNTIPFSNACALSSLSICALCSARFSSKASELCGHGMAGWDLPELAARFPTSLGNTLPVHWLSQDESLLKGNDHLAVLRLRNCIEGNNVTHKSQLLKSKVFMVCSAKTNLDNPVVCNVYKLPSKRVRYVYTSYSTIELDTSLMSFHIPARRQALPRASSSPFKSWRSVMDGWK